MTLKSGVSGEELVGDLEPWEEIPPNYAFLLVCPLKEGSTLLYAPRE